MKGEKFRYTVCAAAGGIYGSVNAGCPAEGEEYGIYGCDQGNGYQKEV